MEDSRCVGDWLKALTPGIQTQKEKEQMPKLNTHQSELKAEELFYRVMHRGS